MWIDEDKLLIGTSLIEQLATAVEGVDYLLALVSPASVDSRWCQKEISMALTEGIGREGVQVLPVRVGDVEIPATLRDQVYQQLDPENLEVAIGKIVRDVRRYNDRKHKIGAKAVSVEARSQARTGSIAGIALTTRDSESDDEEFDPIEIVGVVREGVTTPRNDGTRGSGLYRIPLRLSRRPPVQWAGAFPEAWNRPPSFTNMHRPGIASVVNDTIVLDGTTMEELEKYHAETLKVVVADLNKRYADFHQDARAQRQAERMIEQSHRSTVDDIANRLDFGSR